jgi:hypothetical protein
MQRMRQRTTRRVAPLLAVLIVSAALLNTACPSSTDLDRMAKASNELAHDVLLANRVVAEFYKSGRMSLAAKDKIADKLGVIGDKGNKFNEILIQLDAKYPQGTLPPQDLDFVRQNLSELRQLYAEVVADLLPFGAQKAVSELNKDLTTIEKVVANK